MIGQSVSRNSITLGLFAIITTGMIVLTANLTEDRIAQEQENALKRNLFEVMPPSQVENDLLNSTIEIQPSTLLGSQEMKKAYIAKQKQQTSGVILQVTAAEGYGGSIHLLVGISAKGNIQGVRVIPPHFETPGLGDAIEIQKSEWITSFNGKSLFQPKESGWQVKKDGGEFDSFTGATITPRTIVSAVYKALQYFDQNKNTLLAGAQAEHSDEDTAHAQ